MTPITEYHLHLENQFNLLFSDIKNDCKNTVLKTYKFTICFLFRDEKGEWKKHVVSTEDTRNIYCGIQLPKSDKKLHAYLLKELPKVKESHAPVFGPFFDSIYKELESSRPGSEKANIMVRSFKIANTNANNSDWSIAAKNDCKELIYPKFNTLGSDCMIEKMNITLQLMQKDDFSKSERKTFSANFTQKCKTCDGFRTTAHKLNECSGCLKEIPDCNPESFIWQAHEVKINHSTGEASTDKI